MESHDTERSKQKITINNHTGHRLDVRGARMGSGENETLIIEVRDGLEPPSTESLAYAARALGRLVGALDAAPSSSNAQEPASGEREGLALVAGWLQVLALERRQTAVK